MDYLASNIVKAAFVILLIASIVFLAVSVWLLYTGEVLPSLLSLLIGLTLLSTSLSVLRKLLTVAG
ncbi:hypothetical protein DKAM_0443 [Desulfurococcus amylolyticus 1221n]|uniref:Uncharacterized protein n=1 Tax=Desulfurococcus amylolyticus (strain DSM 18924 / JCM 16383 / VKM B-2413 / 1221n) TaxID=490899 RepID=B8D3T8_DESA1|nr:hypothetical protein [Desulfurococcus amylolyticus]ACL10769.1 hypothetical protein DKAM_0443 [Desulfurococcus amylolyticus 1221n]